MNLNIIKVLSRYMLDISSKKRIVNYSLIFKLITNHYENQLSPFYSSVASILV